MDILAEEELIENTTRKDFAQNSLVLIVPASSALNITGIESLTSPDVERIAIGNPETVPVGNYTRTALTEAGIWNQLENKFVLAEDVKAVLTYVERGEVDAWRQEHAPEGLAAVMHRPYGALQCLPTQFYEGALNTLLDWTMPGGVGLFQIPDILLDDDLSTICQRLRSRQDVANIFCPQASNTALIYKAN